MKYRRGILTDKEMFGDLLPKKTQRGRNTGLLAARDECLYHRYYYYRKIQQKDYAQALVHLQQEFYLSMETLPRIIDRYVEEIRQLQATATPAEALREKYPCIVW